MILIELNRMPKNCEECAFCLKINKLAVYCMATRFQIKYDETDLRDGMCPIHDLELAPVVHGHWETPEKQFPFWDWKCSACGCEEYRQRDSHGNYRRMNFCPNCGAKMNESEDNDNA